MERERGRKREGRKRGGREGERDRERERGERKTEGEQLAETFAADSQRTTGQALNGSCALGDQRAIRGQVATGDYHSQNRLVPTFDPMASFLSALTRRPALPGFLLHCFTEVFSLSLCTCAV